MQGVSSHGVGVRSRASRDTWHVTLGTAASYSGLLVSHTCHCHAVTRASTNTGNTAGLGHCTAWSQLNISCKKGTNDWFWLVRSHCTDISFIKHQWNCSVSWHPPIKSDSVALNEILIVLLLIIWKDILIFQALHTIDIQYLAINLLCTCTLQSSHSCLNAFFSFFDTW